MNPRTAESWIRANEWLGKQSGIPAILAREVMKHVSKAMRQAIPAKPRIRLPRGLKAKTPQGIKKDLKKELEALCKAIVFTRDCGSPEAREGNCISCGRWHVLQWGHFIAQNHSKYLQYSPQNTAGQCAGCNGPGGRGRPLEFADAINKREGFNVAGMLRALAAQTKGWRANRVSLGNMLEELKRHPLAPKAEP